MWDVYLCSLEETKQEFVVAVVRNDPAKPLSGLMSFRVGLLWEKRQLMGQRRTVCRSFFSCTSSGIYGAPSEGLTQERIAVWS